MTAVACLCTATAMGADYSGTVTQDPTTDYSNGYYQLTLTEVATALGTDAATLDAYLDSLYSADAEGILEVISDDGTYTTAYTGNTGEFWLDEDGNATSWGDGSVWFVGSGWSDESDYYYIYVGQYPSACEGGEEYSVTLALVYGESEVTFDITLQVNEVVEQYVSDLTSVGSGELSVEIDDGTAAYETVTATIDVETIASALGCSTSDLDMVPLSEEGTLYSGTGTANNGGCWMSEEGYVTSWGDGSVWFFEPVTSGDYSSINFGLFDEAEEGTEYTASIYFVYDTSYYELSVSITVVEAEESEEESTTLSDYTSVGSSELTVEIEDGTAAYGTVTATIDVETIASALGCSTSDLDMVPLAEAGTLYSETGTANNGGSWMDEEGYVTSWGDGSVWFFEPVTSGDYSSINFGLYDEAEEGTEYTCSIYFVYDTYYYELLVTITVVEAEESEEESTTLSDYTSVGSSELTVEIEDGTAAYTAVSAEIDVETIASALGCSTSDLEMVPLEEEGTLYSGNGTANNGGCWMDEDGYAVSWGDGSVWYFEPATSGDYSTINFGLMDEAEEGTEYTCSIYFVYDSSYYEVVVTITVVEATYTLLSDLTLAGSGELTVEIEEGSDYATCEIDVDVIAAALGCSTSDIEIAGLAEENTLANSYTAYNGGSWVDEDGYVTSWGDGSVWYYQPETDGDYSVIDFGLYDSEDAGTTYTGAIYFLYDTYYYELAVTINIVEANYTLLSDLTSVGSGELSIEIEDGTEAYSTVTGTIDVETIANALGCSTSDLEMTPLAEEGALYSGTGTANNGGSWMDEDGYVTSWGDGSVWFFEPVTSGDYSSINFGLYDEAEAGTEYTASIYFVYDSYYYELTVTITVPTTSSEEDDTETGISGISDDDILSSDEIYDLSGRKVTNPSKGVYIIGGKKLLIK